MIKRISVDVTGEMFEAKAKMGVKWSWLINEGLKAQDLRQRIVNKNDLITNLENQIIVLKNDLAISQNRLESYFRRSGNIENGS